MARFSDKDYQEMPEAVLRAIIRENTHHRLEEPLYGAMHEDKPLRPNAPEGIRHLLEIWQARGLSDEGADLQWSEQLLALADELKAGGQPTLDTEPMQPFTPNAQEVVDDLIRERRSIRRWTDQEVPRELIDKVIDAGLWAAHACNLQTLRFLVITDPAELNLFKRSEVMGGPMRIVVCQDLRPYDCTAGVPDKNRLLDCGAAVQNMLLMAHALGLGAVWLTFGEAQEKLIRSHFELPDYIAIQTYLALGFPNESPLAPGRLSVADVVLNRR